MRFLRALMPIAVFAAMIVLASSASATIITSPSGTTYTGEVKASGGTVTLSGSFVTVECKKVSSVAGKVESHGASVTAAGKLASLTGGECNFPVTINKGGSAELHTDGESANGNGTATSTGAEITIATSIGTCIFTTNATDVGTVKGGTPAVIEVKGAKIPRTGGSAGFLCGSTGTLNGSLTANTPGTLLVD